MTEPTERAPQTQKAAPLETPGEAAPKSLIPDLYKFGEAMIAETPFNADGVSLTVLGSANIANLDRAEEGSKANLVWVRLQPGAKVAAHLHEAGGELELPLTPVISVMGEPVRNEAGELAYDDDGNVKTELEEPVMHEPLVATEIPQGKVHEFINPSDEAYADILFFLPADHATAIDKKLAASPYAGEVALQGLRQLLTPSGHDKIEADVAGNQTRAV